MDNIPAQPDPPVEEIQEPVPQGEIPHTSPFKRFLPFVIVGVVVLLLLSIVLLVFAARRTPKQIGVATPTIRPTATPIVGSGSTNPSPIIQVPTSVVQTESSAMYFMRSGDIYQGNFINTSLLVKNEMPAGDKLTVSSKRAYLAWRPKSEIGLPSAVVVYNTALQKTKTLQDNPPAEIIDFAWDPSEKNLSIVLFNGTVYRLLFYTNIFDTPSPVPSVLLARETGIKQIFWLTSNIILFTGNDGIGAIDITGASPSATLIVNKPNIIRASLSPDKKMLLYSAGVIKKSDLFTLSLEDNTEQIVTPIPASVDMGKSGVASEVLAKGFIPYSLWFPDGKRILVGYQHLPNMPLVGVYDLTASSFAALGVFALYASDQIIGENQLIGVRPQLGTDTPSWNITEFSLKKDTPFTVLHSLPDASSLVYIP